MKVGNGARVLIERALRGTGREDEVDEGLRAFLQHYAEHCTARTVPYPGVSETLSRLRDANCRLAVLTNKPQTMAEAILDAAGLTASSKPP